MSDKIEYSRLILKRTDGAGVIPTTPTGTTLDTFTATDTFEGELFLNIADDKMWVRTQNGQIPIFLSGNTGFTSDYFVTGATYSAGTITFYNNNGTDFNVNVGSLAFSGGSGNCITDLYITNLYGCSPIGLNNSIIMYEDVDAPGQGVQLQSFSGNSFIAFDKGYINEGVFLQADHPTIAGNYGKLDVTPIDIFLDVSNGGLSQASILLQNSRQANINVDNLTGSTNTYVNLIENNIELKSQVGSGVNSTINVYEDELRFYGDDASGSTQEFNFYPTGITHNLVGVNNSVVSSTDETLIKTTLERNATGDNSFVELSNNGQRASVGTSNSANTYTSYLKSEQTSDNANIRLYQNALVNNSETTLLLDSGNLNGGSKIEEFNTNGDTMSLKWSPPLFQQKLENTASAETYTNFYTFADYTNRFGEIYLQADDITNSRITWINLDPFNNNNGNKITADDYANNDITQIYFDTNVFTTSVSLSSGAQQARLFLDPLGLSDQTLLGQINNTTGDYSEIRFTDDSFAVQVENATTQYQGNSNYSMTSGDITHNMTNTGTNEISSISQTPTAMQLYVNDGVNDIGKLRLDFDGFNLQNELGASGIKNTNLLGGDSVMVYHNRYYVNNFSSSSPNTYVGRYERAEESTLTGATTTTINIGGSIPTGSTSYIETRVTAANSDGTKGYFARITGAYRRDDNGDYYQIGTDDVYDVTDFTGVTTNLIYNVGSAPDVELTGEAGETIKFKVIVKWGNDIELYT
jgi:hypothetical protein